jgi:hypothetical protein
MIVAVVFERISLPHNSQSPIVGVGQALGDYRRSIGFRWRRLWYYLDPSRSDHALDCCDYYCCKSHKDSIICQFKTTKGKPTLSFVNIYKFGCFIFGTLTRFLVRGFCKRKFDGLQIRNFYSVVVGEYLLVATRRKRFHYEVEFFVVIWLVGWKCLSLPIVQQIIQIIIKIV